MTRRVFAYTVIVVGVLSAAILSLVINLASNSVQVWLLTQGWYDARLLWIIAGILVVIGVVLAILQSRSDPPTGTSTGLTVEAGIVDPRRYLNPPEGTATPDETAMLFILDIPPGATGIVQCLIRIKNTGQQGLSGVRVQVEYPEQYLVQEGTVITFDDAAAVLGGSTKHIERSVKREVVVLEGVARVSYKIDFLRFKETTFIPEPLKFRRPRPNDQQATTMAGLHQRLAVKPNFLDWVRMRVFVFAQEAHKQEGVDIFAFAGADQNDLSAAIAAIKDAIWNGTPPQPGGYVRNPSPRWRTSRLEMSVPQFKIEVPGLLYQEHPMAQELLGIATIMLPDVNFRHTNDRPKLGLHIPAKKDALHEMTMLTPRPPID